MIVKASNSVVKVIVGVSIVVPLLVAVLMFAPVNLGISGDWLRTLPMVNAILNSTTAVCLILAVVFVRKNRIDLHQAFMSMGLLLGALFLISYVIYHSNATTVKFGDINHDGILDTDELMKVGLLRPFYVLVLASHILLSIVVVPFVLSSFYFALSDQVAKHKKVVKYTFPIWLYVSVTGVIVYFMISPYYI